MPKLHEQVILKCIRLVPHFIDIILIMGYVLDGDLLIGIGHPKMNCECLISCKSIWND